MDSSESVDTARKAPVVTAFWKVLKVEGCGTSYSEVPYSDPVSGTVHLFCYQRFKQHRQNVPLGSSADDTLLKPCTRSAHPQDMQHGLTQHHRILALCAVAGPGCAVYDDACMEHGQAFHRPGAQTRTLLPCGGGESAEEAHRSQPEVLRPCAHALAPGTLSTPRCA
eukprot:353460-Chlamydomonas_euryale.AAC.6